MNKDIYQLIQRLEGYGISYNDAVSLRRISMTLQRVHELECGDSNGYCSSALVRGYKKDGSFVYDEDDGQSYMEIHPHTGKTYYTKVPDRERGARKRLAAIMAQYPELTYYIQGDPRGCALYVIKKSDVEADKLDQRYNRGIAVYK